MWAEKQYDENFLKSLIDDEYYQKKYINLNKKKEKDSVIFAETLIVGSGSTVGFFYPLHVLVQALEF